MSITGPLFRGILTEPSALGGEEYGSGKEAEKKVRVGEIHLAVVQKDAQGGS